MKILGHWILYIGNHIEYNIILEDENKILLAFIYQTELYESDKIIDIETYADVEYVEDPEKIKSYMNRDISRVRSYSTLYREVPDEVISKVDAEVLKHKI